MKTLSIKTAVFGLATLFAAAALYAQSVDALVDDNQDGTDQNEFEQYWYYYDDNSGVKDDDRPIADPTSEPSVIQVPYTEVPRYAFGNQQDLWKVKEYTFLIAEEGVNKFVRMPFLYGKPWTASYGKAMPYVGVGTMLAPDGKSCDLTGAQSVSFKIRSRVQDLSVVFKVETKDISDDSSFAYYQKTISVGTDWATVTVQLSEDDLAQPGWTPAAAERAFALDKVTKLAWEVPGTLNDITGDTLDIDDIVITHYVFVSPTVFPNGPLVPQTGTVFSTFEGTYKDQTPFNTYWFAYNDAAIGGNSSVNRGADIDPATGLLKLAFEPTSGSDGIGNAPYIDFTLGKMIEQPNTADPTKTDKIQGFSGIGFNVYDSATSTFFNASTGTCGTRKTDSPVDGIYFEYLADGDFKYMTLEVSDIYDVGDATGTIPPYSRGSGIVAYRNFLKTGIGTWRSATILFSDLMYNDTWKGYVNIPLDITRLAKVQFKVQGAEGDAGVLAIDNVNFTSGVAVRHGMTRQNNTGDFTTGYGNGAVSVSWKNGTVVKGTILLLNTKGAVVASAPVSKTTSLSSRISAARLPAGFYFVQFKGIDVKGNAITRQGSVSIVK